MKDYTKYALKPQEELKALLQDMQDIYILACNKCFQEFLSMENADQEALENIVCAEGKTITGSKSVDFLCNKTLSAKGLELPAGTKAVLVAACGLGVQTVADLVDVPVYAASDSLHYTGHHGMALTQKTCEACAQCYLNLTGGICPVVDCSKSLLNGQCGGAKNGKCEVSPDKLCAWEQIQQRLAQQGRLEELTAQSIQLRDYSKVSFKVVNDYVKSIREDRFAGYYGGIHPAEHKEPTEHLAVERLPEPKTVAINLAQHAGAPAICVVKVGDYVKVGQKVGQTSGVISSNLHASVSGTVVAIEERLHATRGNMTTCVVIANDGKHLLHESVKPGKPLEELTPEEIVETVKEAGIIGMGGAGFPMCVKLMPNKPIDTVLLNGCECEPLLTADHRLMLEHGDAVILGLKAMMKAVNAQEGIIAIEDNKPDAIALMEQLAAGQEHIRVVSAKTKYPQGAEKMLIKRCLGRQVPNGGLPADVGCVVANVSTSKAIADAITQGMPLVERIVTVTGRVKNPGNFLVKLGTSAQELLDHCGGVAGQGDYVVKIGGPMMGTVQTDLQVPLTKCSNGITVYDVTETQEVECIQCGRCVDVCPMELKPLYYAKLVKQEDWEQCRDKGIMNCLECRCCQYICSSKIPLVEYIKAGKTAVRGLK